MPAEHANGPPQLVNFFSFLRGDRYMIGAYPPEWQEPTAPPPVNQHAGAGRIGGGRMTMDEGSIRSVVRRLSRQHPSGGVR